MTARLRASTLFGLFGLVVVLATVLSLPAARADVAAKRVGDITIYAANSNGKSIRQGGSSTQFVLGLPDGSACPGDSANDDWRTEGFLAPVGVDPATLQYNAVGAVGPGVFPLYDVTTRSYRHALLEPNDKKGEPGRIPQLPVMSFATYPPDYVPAGHYAIGIACTYFRATDKYWTVAVDVLKDSHDSPAQLTWSVAGSTPAASGRGGTNRLPLVIALVAVAGVGGVLVFRRSNRSTRRLDLAKEKS